MKTRMLVMVGVIAMFGVNFGRAQVHEVLRVKVPFEFTVGSKVLPAGQYEFSRVALNNAIQVTSVNGGPSGDATVVGRVWAGIHITPKDCHIVFDQVGDKYIFSELWIPGSDGYLFNVTKEKHTYKTITVPY